MGWFDWACAIFFGCAFISILMIALNYFFDSKWIENISGFFLTTWGLSWIAIMLILLIAIIVGLLGGGNILI